MKAPLLFLSPCLCEGNFGGVQLSGRIVRDRLVREGAGNVRCVYFGGAPGIHHDDACTASRMQAARKVFSLRGVAGDLLFWHAGMLKLLPAAGGRGRKVYLFLHGIECWRALDPVTQYLMRSVTCFLTNSAFTWRRFTEMNPKWAHANHRIVPLGLGLPETVHLPPGKTPAALVLGRMQKGEGYKGHEELIRAWPLVRKRVPAAELWIAGGGSLDAEFKRLAAEIGEASHIRFFGVIPDEEKQRLIEQASCLALPSKGEGFGLVYLEAMRSGRPCLSSTLDAGREVVNPPQAGLSVDPADAAALSEALIRLLTPGAEWQRWSEAARARYESQFTARHFEGRLLAALSGAGQVMES